MDILTGLVRLAAVIALAFLAGRLVARFRLPAILGWLIAGMILGPNAVGLLSSNMMDSGWYGAVEGLMECTAGMMIGTELILGNMKRTGGQLLVMTVAESLGTFLVVSLAFGILFWMTGMPVYLAFLFGGIALATAPAPSLSIVNEFKTSVGGGKCQGQRNVGESVLCRNWMSSGRCIYRKSRSLWSFRWMNTK